MISPTRAKSPVMIALVATVVPCVTDSTGPVPARSTSRIAAAIASWGALGDEGSLATTIRAPSISTQSVNVPPVSTPIRTGQTSSPWWTVLTSPRRSSHVRPWRTTSRRRSSERVVMSSSGSPSSAIRSQALPASKVPVS